MQYRDGIKRLLPDQIPCKENLGILGAELLRNTSDTAAVLRGHVKTATDVLRIAVAMRGATCRSPTSASSVAPSGLSFSAGWSSVLSRTHL
ncbi:hypothetical protein [Limnoglobus roseus]|uniref:Uncharacterized protein n=1 Tax=Limnoglobus roseus TaxID=2598579 RepID=A0A5C1AH85_9BACT|nr:hypothetical protein [Limnoglobus roseus]QEL18581.1 hypothetical protein PX52LOC_05613 [Limnoglobus roseus]